MSARPTAPDTICGDSALQYVHREKQCQTCIQLVLALPKTIYGSATDKNQMSCPPSADSAFMLLMKQQQLPRMVI